MASGRVHDLVGVFFTPIIGGVSYYLTEDIFTTLILCGSFIFSTLMFNGDLDIKSSPYYRWSILRFIWIPYINTFKHRSIFTHGIIIGTLIRLLYISIIPIAILIFNDIEIMPLLTNEYFFIIIIGIELGSALHTVLDFLPKYL